MRVRDSQRSKVYRAEKILEGRSKKQFKPLDEVVTYIKDVYTSKWFRKHFTGLPYTILDGRGNRCASASTGVAAVTFRFPRWSRKDWVILHEISHAVIDHEVAWHGREFCMAYLKLVKHFMGDLAFKALKDSFKKNKVKYKKKKQLSEETRQKLSEALKGKLYIAKTFSVSRKLDLD